MTKVLVSRVSCVMPPRTRRTVIETLMVWFPWAYRVIGDLIMRVLPPCRLRRWIVRTHTVSGWAAICRRDYRLTLVRYMPDLHYEVDGGFQGLGLPANMHGREAMTAALAEWSEGWEWWGIEPLAIVDMEDRLLGLGRFRARGRKSGVEIDEEYAQLITIRPGTGMVMHEHDFIDWRQGFVAAGLDPRRFAGLLDDLVTRSTPQKRAGDVSRIDGTPRPRKRPSAPPTFRAQKESAPVGEAFGIGTTLGATQRPSETFNPHRSTKPDLTA